MSPPTRCIPLSWITSGVRYLSMKTEISWKYGFSADGLEEAREKIQRQEICRGLLHARQLLVNRAFLQNSTVFIHWYKAAGTKEYDAFCRLLENGSILLVLYREQMPCEETAYGNTDWEAWKHLCAEHVTYCLRMDWDNEENNEMETDRRMGFPFHNYCVTTAENKYRMEEMIRALSLPGEKAEQLKKKWKLDPEKSDPYQGRNRKRLQPQPVLHRSYH